MELPYRGYMPYVWEGGEGLLPRNYSRLEADFYIPVTGSPLYAPEIVVKDGKKYAWMEVED